MPAVDPTLTLHATQSSPAMQRGVDSMDLPDGWERRADEHGNEFYWDSRSESAIWTRPTQPVESATLPEGWSAHVDDDGNT